MGEKPMPKELLTDLDFKALTNRKLTEETCRKYSYGVSKTGQSTWQVAPYYNQAGELVGQHQRGPNKTFRWRGTTQNLQLFGQRLFRKNGKMVIVTEGEIDCLTLSQVQGNKEQFSIYFVAEIQA